MELIIDYGMRHSGITRPLLRGSSGTSGAGYDVVDFISVSVLCTHIQQTSL